MLIRTLLVAGLAVGAALVAGRLTVAELSARTHQQLDAYQADAERISRAAAGLLVLGQDYLTHETPRAARQWRATHDELQAVLARHAAPDDPLPAQIGTLRKVADGLPALLEATEAALRQGSAGTARRDLLADHLMAETHRISDGAFVLGEALGELRRRVVQRDLLVTRATMAAFATLVLLLAIVISRRVLRPMAGLERAAQSIRSGAFDARSAYRAGDEFGRLSFTFDAMAGTLQSALRENDAMLSTVRLHGIVSVADRTGDIVEVNDNFCAISGYRRDELVGQNHRIVNSDLHPRAFWVDMWRTIASGRPWRGEIRNRAKDGSLYWVDSMIAPFLGADGKVEKYLSIRFDVTERKQLELRLAEGERFLRQVTDGLPIRIAYIDRERRYRFVNQAHCRRFGRERGEILGRTRAELIGPVPPDVDARLSSALEGHEQRFEFAEQVDGRSRYIESRLTPDRDEGGAVVGVFATGTDITERKLAEIELRSTSSLLTTVLDSASEVSIIATDPDGTIRVFNRGAERMLGWRADEVVGRVKSMEFHDRDEIEARATELSARLGRPVGTGLALVDPDALGQAHEWTYVRKDGSRVSVSLAVTAMRADDGHLFGYLGVAHDVTRQKQAQASLREAVHRARQANQAKSQFLANMSHEIRTPMNAVIGLTYLLEQTRLDAEQVGFLAKIKASSKSLLALINDILDLSKVEAGELAIESTPFSVRHLLRDVADVAQMQAQAREIEFHLDCAGDVPPHLVGDATRLAQVLTNLVSNAIKFTEHGGVALRVRCAGVQPPGERVRLRFEVQDSGIGIAPEIQAKLFAPFVQADASMTRRFGGTGLGLSIVKTLVGLMGGTVGLRSALGQGSEFAVELEFGRVALEAGVGAPAGAVAAARLDGLHVLVVDDSDINLDVAKRILEHAGARVSLASNGQEGSEMVLGAPGAFDAVLMDVQMPVMDGYEATRRIRQSHGAKVLPILALTAGALTSEVKRATEAGMNAFITKPFDPRSLVRAIASQAKPTRLALPAQPSAHGGVAPWPEIAGIATNEVRERLDGDTTLFLSMLGRMLDEYADLVTESALPDGVALKALAVRMHKLRGSAGLLGAREVQRLATEAEDAAVRADPAEAQRWTRQTAEALASLRAAALPVLQFTRKADGHQAADPAGVVDPAQLQDLTRLLRRHNLEALDRFEALAPQLRKRLGSEAFHTLRDQVEGLQFERAVNALEQLRG